MFLIKQQMSQRFNDDQLKASQTSALKVSLSEAVLVNSNVFLSLISHEHSVEFVHQCLNSTAQK